MIAFMRQRYYPDLPAPLTWIKILRRRSELFFGREVEGGGVVLEMAFVGAIAKRLVLGTAAAADTDNLPPRQAINIAIPVYYLKIPFQLERSIAIHRDLGRCHYCNFWAN
jgi:hypothetical protein